MQWKNDSVDLYDCRTRSWYIEAAASPKDVLILVDNSGSMTGMRKEIARHVVSNILDTLGNNDFVNVFNFSEEIDEVVPCFKDMLVQVMINMLITVPTHCLKYVKFEALSKFTIPSHSFMLENLRVIITITEHTELC